MECLFSINKTWGNSSSCKQNDNGEKYVCIARTVEKGIGRFGQSKSILSIGLVVKQNMQKILFIQKI